LAAGAGSAAFGAWANEVAAKAAAISATSSFFIWEISLRMDDPKEDLLETTRQQALR
jgi:hypothetical protein